MNPIPQPDPILSASRSLWVEKRWKEYEPWMVMASRKHLDPASYLYGLKQTHTSRIRILFLARISWSAIRRYKMDDPTIPEEVFALCLKEAVERHRARLGRVKGKGRKYNRNRNRKRKGES